MILVTENFRYASGLVARYQTIAVYLRGGVAPIDVFLDPDGTVPKDPVKTDNVGNLSFYIDPGTYDFEIFDTRIPFDVLDPEDVAVGGAIEAHRNDLTPHPVYDDGPSWALKWSNAIS